MTPGEEFRPHETQSGVAAEREKEREKPLADSTAEYQIRLNIILRAQFMQQHGLRCSTDVVKNMINRLITQAGNNRT